MISGRVVVGALAAAALLASWSAGTARAHSIILNATNVTGPVAGIYTYTYSVLVTGGSQINSGTVTAAGGQVPTAGGDYFRLIDFGGYVTGSASGSLLTTVGGASWQVSTSLTGLTATDNVIVPDNASILNINFQYIGTNVGLNGTQSIKAVADTSIGSVTLQSTLPAGAGNIMYYGAQDENTSTGTDQSNQGLMNGPVPEPASLGILGLGVLGLLARRTRKA